MAGFQISKFYFGFRIPLAGLRIPKPWIPDSTDENYLDSGSPHMGWPQVYLEGDHVPAHRPLQQPRNSYKGPFSPLLKLKQRSKTAMIKFIHSFLSAVQIHGKIPISSSSISTSTGLWWLAPSLPDSSTGETLHRNRRGQGWNPRSGLNFSGLSRCCLSSDKKLRWSNSFIQGSLSKLLLP